MHKRNYSYDGICSIGDTVPGTRHGQTSAYGVLCTVFYTNISFFLC